MRTVRLMMITAVAILALCPTALAENGKISGDITVTGVVVEGKDQNAKFNEYRDIRDGAQTDIQVKYDGPRSHLSLEAKDILYRNQKYTVEGGMWDIFNVRVFYDEIPHNFTYDARTFYSGVGSSNLTYATATPAADPNSWSTFDYAVKRRHMGGDLKFDYLNPFYAELSVDQQRKSGVYPLGAAGTSPGGIVIELPINIEYVADNVKAEAGYSSKALFVSGSYFYSRFKNGDGYQNFRNPATVDTAAATDTLFLPPENDYMKYDVKGALALPFHSRLNADLSTSRARSTAPLINSYVTSVTAAASNIGIQGLNGITLSAPTFNGYVTTDQLNLALTTNPRPFIQAKVFYKYYNKDNKSDRIITIDGMTVLENELFDYRKNMYGIEGFLKLPASFRLNAGYSFTKTERARDDIPKNRDTRIDVGLKWSGLKFLSTKIGYERLDRSAEFNVPASVAPADLEYWVRRFDAAPQIRDTYKASVEFFPVESLNINVGYKHRYANYNNTILGLKEAKSNEVNADIDWMIHERLRLFGHFDFEQRFNNQFQRQTSVNNDPSTAPTASNFNWTSDAEERSYAYGVGADIMIMTDKLYLKLAHNFVKSDGSVDYTYLLGAVALPAGQTQDNIDLNAWDNYRLSNFVAKATYQVTKTVAVSAAYAYEAYSYDDSQYRNYSYVPGTTGYMTGAYRDDSYKTHVFFAGVNVKF